jgi:uncharacterized membrane protein
MRTSRLEAFSDGVLAIIITIMVLALNVPEEPSLQALGHSATGFLTYALSFVYVGIYWNNHHHMFQVVETISGPVLWANLHLLFWLSLFPFSTAWMDETRFARTPTMIYGVNLLLAAVAFSALVLTIYRGPGGGRLRQALGGDLKGRLSPALYLTGLLLCLVNPWVGLAAYTVVAVIWLVPDRRVERFLANEVDAR